MAARPLPEGSHSAEEKLKFKGDPKHGGAHSEWADIPDDKARGFARLGEILRERGRMAAARIEYAKAMSRVGKKIAVLTDKFALAAMASGREGEAESALVEALHVHPQYAALHLHLARVLVKRKDWASAKAHLLAANAVDPFDPEIHAGLSQVHAAENDEGGAARERRFAQILSGH
jgi:predicted Zn-dependent protease